MGGASTEDLLSLGSELPCCRGPVRLRRDGGQGCNAYETLCPAALAADHPSLTDPARRAIIPKQPARLYTPRLCMLKNGPLLLLMAVALLATALTACADGGEPDLTVGDIGDEELAAMLPSLADLGPEYTRFSVTVDPGLGFPADFVEATPDRQDEADDLRRLGLVQGANVWYAGFHAGSTDPTTSSAGLALYLFGDAQSARDYLRDELADWKRLAGSSSEHVVVGAVDGFDPERIGDGSSGMAASMTVSRGDVTLAVNLTSVWLRRGRLVGRATISRADEKDVRAEAEALAHRLDEHIRRILLTPTPTRQGA